MRCCCLESLVALMLAASTLLLLGQLKPVVGADYGGAQSALSININGSSSSSSSVCRFSVEDFIGHDGDGWFLRTPSGFSVTRENAKSCSELMQEAEVRVFGGEQWFKDMITRGEEWDREQKQKDREGETLRDNIGRRMVNAIRELYEQLA